MGGMSTIFAESGMTIIKLVILIALLIFIMIMINLFTNFSLFG